MSSDKDRLFSSSDIQILITFVAGMGAFWLSANLPVILRINFSVTGHPLISLALNLGLALLIYSLIMLIWAMIILRRRAAFKPAALAAGLTLVLALITSLCLTWMGLHNVYVPVAALAFALYFAYGVYFMIGFAVARRLDR